MSVGTVTVPVTSVKPVEIKTAPAQLEEYSTLLWLVTPSIRLSELING